MKRGRSKKGEEEVKREGESEKGGEESKKGGGGSKKSWVRLTTPDVGRPCQEEFVCSPTS